MAADFEVINADCRDVFPLLSTFQSIVCDPPYAIGDWDWLNHPSELSDFTQQWATQALDVITPGAYMLMFAGTRTYHRMVCAVEDAGWEIRDSISWLYSQGFPKSTNAALKPAHELIALCRKPLDGTLAANVMTHGTGALRIDDCRIGTTKEVPASPRRAPQGPTYGELGNDPGTGSGFNPNVGRWPANVVLDEDAAIELDNQSGQLKSGHMEGPRKKASGSTYGEFNGTAESHTYGDTGGASRFFYCAKPSRKEREAGLESLPEIKGRRNPHTTIKPISLMRWLCRLITPPGGRVLDPFCGTGTTGCGAILEKLAFTGIELDPEIARIASLRIKASAHIERG